MNNFDFQNPTRLIFGKGTVAKLGTRKYPLTNVSWYVLEEVALRKTEFMNK